VAGTVSWVDAVDWDPLWLLLQIASLSTIVTLVAVPLVHVAHSIAEARLLADQVVRIERGKVVARGAAADVLANVASFEE
jgi:ABC-type molybdate transport system ATPase subunit